MKHIMSLKTLEKLADFSEINLKDIEKAKEEGRRVVGVCCLHCPYQLVLAAGVIPVSLRNA
jgi:benzoyl-CoA reductase/2-hydroxyglutaryl-CoA dehydratase subunit BcrC/BadD/HgdB